MLCKVKWIDNLIKGRSIMAEKVLMPKAGITVEECIITEWVKSVGDTVSVGDILFHYETDKATFECESTAAGEILAILKEDGDEVPVLEPVCIIGEAGESYSLGDITEERTSLDNTDSSNTVYDSTDYNSNTSNEDTSINTDLELASSNYSDSPKDSSHNLMPLDSSSTEHIKISPRAKIAATKSGMNPIYATPTGPAGRIIEGDIRLLERTHFGSDPTADKLQVSSIANDYEEVKFSGVRRATSKAMLTSLSTMAQVTNQHSFDGTNLINIRKRLKGLDGFSTNISYNDMIIYATSRIIRSHPDLNAHKTENNTIKRFKNVHIGIAVDTPKGLFVPVVRNVNHLTLSEIAIETKRLASLCQEGNITPDLFAEGTFTISNLGALGVEMFTPVVNPPQTAILGVCGITTRVREVAGSLEGYPAMGLALTYDHCVIDGWPASLFLMELGQYLENFDLMLIKELL
jgi:pyruvate dehydrogenase E2 component (dihydrolipoamide acetyltransferase)